MSGSGGRKKGRGGWEEAGGEFYQESYPGGAGGDLDGIATLLPSVQLRGTTARRKRRHSTATATATATKDVLVSMLPDLSEDISTERTTWEEIMLIKAMPVPMAQKRERKAQLQSATKLRLQGLDQLRWKRRKAWQGTRARLVELREKLRLWKSSFKTIEGNFGTGVVAYFSFLSWLFALDLLVSALIVAFVVVPNTLLDPSERNATETFFEYRNSGGAELVFDAFQGTGWMERTPLFYGVYSGDGVSFRTPGNRTEDDWTSVRYDLSVAYLFTLLVYFLVSLTAIVRNAVDGFREKLVEGEGQFYRYCDIVFGGWDFCVDNEKSARIKHRAIYNEIKICLEGERTREEKRKRSKEEQIRLFFVRLLVNAAVVAVLAASGALIFWTFDRTAEMLDRADADTDGVRRFTLQYATSLCIVGLNIVVPVVFQFLIGYEKYRPVTVVKLTLARTILLRFSSLILLLTKLYLYVVSQESDAVRCWETYVGQQLYKLLITDFAAQVCVTFLLNFPRSLMARGSESGCVKTLGEQEFRLPKHVLDVAYTQTVCWLGVFYCPALPLITTAVLFLMFYVKKFACLVNSKPPTTLYRAAKSESLFMAVLLFGFCVAAVPIGYAIAELPPSRSCGPFRNLTTVWERAVITFGDLPDALRESFFFFGTSVFAVPAFVVLLLSLYYYWAVADANRHMVSVLKSQLVLEGHDKQFLLNRLSAFIRQQYKKNERARQHQTQAGTAEDESIRQSSK